ncbi:MAG: hypothetical protein LQ343_000401 [Gyalolechia ehrenbergii]|nr:MAG: hypothetical protein LQ343_000401 [Gyalolechia ehrenbergii]
MPWRPLPRIAFAVAIYPFLASSPADLPLELGDELYIIEQGGVAGEWYRGYLVAPPSLLSGLTSVRGQTLEARVFSGIFPRNCVEVREVLDDPIADEQVPSSDFEHGISTSKLPNGDSAHTTNAFQHRRSVRRHGSKKGYPPNGGSVAATDSAQDSGIGSLPSRSPSRRARNLDDSQGLSRNLSHRSIRSLRSQGSVVRLSPIAGGAQDRPPAPVPMLKIGDETPTSLSEPLVDEIASCLREWHSKYLHELLLSRRYSVLEQLAGLVRQLDVSRRQLLHGILTGKELERKREQTVWSLVRGNRLLGGEVIVRDPKRAGRLLTNEDSAVEMSKLQSTMSLLEQPPVSQLESTNLHHLMFELKGFADCNLNEPDLTIYICSSAKNERPKAITESMVISIFSGDSEQGTTPGRYKTLFSNLNSLDTGQAPGSETNLYLVIKVHADQKFDLTSQVSQRMESTMDAGSSPAMSRESLTPAAASMRRGRQSLMWAQKQLGSTRRRVAPDLQGSRADRSGNLLATSQETSRPNTSQTLGYLPQQGAQSVRRLVAVGFLDIRKLMAQESSEERRLTLWSPAVDEAASHGSTTETDQLLARFMPSANRRYVQSSSIQYVDVTLQSFSCPDSEELIMKTPTLLQGILQTPSLGFSDAPNKPRSDIYLTLSEAYLPVKALLSHPESGPVPLLSDIDYSNIQLTLEVRRKSGERIEHCIYPYSDGAGITAWRTTAVDRGASWDQVVKLALPEEDVHEAHLIMSVANAPGFPFALCWIPLWDQDAFIRDGSHQPLLYLYDKVTSSSDKGRGAYMALPWNSRARDDTTKDEMFTGPVATLQIQTYLCSTVISQDRVLAGLLRWRDQPEEQLLGLLRQFTFVPETDIVKLVNDLFDALFAILVSNAGKDEYEDLVFNALVTILGIVHDRRFNLGPLIDRYTEAKFDYPFATPCLIRSYLRLLARPADPQNSRRLHATFKVGRQMLKFITTARAKQKMKENSIGVSNDLSFRREYRSIFTAFESVMRDTSPILVGSKTLIVQHLHSWLPSGDDTFSEDEVYQIVSSFMSSCSEVQGKLILYKLLLVLHLSKRTTFTQSAVQGRVAVSTEAWIEPYWGIRESSHSQWRDQVRICCSIVSAQSEEFGAPVPRFFSKIVESYQTVLAKSHGHKRTGGLELLFPSSYPFPTRPVFAADDFDESLIELGALLCHCSGSSLSQALDDLGAARIYVISAALDTLSSILGGDAFPNRWLSLHVYHHHAALHVLETLHETMAASFLPSPDDADDFNTGLWSKFFITLLTLVGSKTLALETFSEQKRRGVWKIAGDVREQGANLLKQSWKAIGWEAAPDDQQRYGVLRIGGFQVQYVPSLVGPIVELCLSVHEGLRRTAVRILQTMIVSEWTLSEDLSVIEAEVIDCLDNTFKSKGIGENISQKIFVNELLDHFEGLARLPGDGLWQAIKSLVSTVDELLDLLAAVHSPEITEPVRIMHTLQLMDYLRDMRKEAIYIRYVHQLADVQNTLQNYTEAGLALRLHASLYQWVPETVAAISDPAFPEQASFERKEQLYFEMIKHFEEGAAWDCALTSYKELAEQYEHHQYDFAKLARTQHSMARNYESIAKGERQSPRYFRVVYRGLGFPNSLRDKEFIFQGESTEKQAEFADRVRLQHPAAQVAPPGDVDNLEGQFLQISAVTPYRDLEHPLYQLSKVPQSVREHILQSQPNRFVVTSRRHSPATGVQDQWIEKTVYSTVDAFPTILGKSEIVSVDVIQLSPLQTAVERTTRKTSELAALQRRISDGDESAFANLTESIKTSVDPISLASVAQYRQLLPSSPELIEDDESLAEVAPLEPMHNALKQALLDHVSTLRHCLALYTYPPHINLQASLSDSLQSTFAPELALLAPPAVMPSPPPTSYRPQSSSLPPSRGFSSDLPILNPLTNGITALPQPGVSDNEGPPITRTRSRLSLSFLKAPSKSNGSINPEASASTLSPDEDSLSSASRPTGKNGSSKHIAENQYPQKPGLGRMKSQSSATEESERPMTAQSGRSGRMKKRLSMLGIGKGSVKSRSGGRNAVEVVEE